MSDCIFCKIIDGAIPSKKEYEDEMCIAFHDIHPKGRVHLLVIPRKHVATVADMTDTDEALMGRLVNVARNLAAKHNCPGYQLKFFVGEKGGQEVFHVHLHMVGV